VIDLDAYLARIGYAGPREPTVETLRGLHHAHLYTVPFENLDVLLKRPIRLDPDSLQQKIVTGGRGGYCFESNGLFMFALQTLGFNVTPLAARVLSKRTGSALPPRSHMLLMVDIEDGLYLADVGFGAETPPEPLKLAVGIEQPTSHEPYRLRRTEDGELDLQSSVAGEWGTLYRFTLHPQLPVDFEHANWFVSTHPDSFFTANLTAALPGEGCRHTLFNGEFRTRWLDGRVEARALQDAAMLAAVLSESFGIAVSSADAEALSALNR
jgi:N-hydroxyarylamine O-acetyltransferase